MLHKKGLQLLAARNEHLEGAPFDSETEAESQTFQMDAVAGQQLHVGVVNKTDAVHVDYLQVGSVGLDLRHVYHFINFLFFFISEFKSS